MFTGLIEAIGDVVAVEHLPGAARLFVSSEIGADKPDPEIFRRAVRFLGLQPGDVLHVGDDPERDWHAAAAAGLSIFRLDRTKNSLRDLLAAL